MSDNTGSVFGGLRRLTQFSGRERRARFWPYAALVVVGCMVLGWIFAAPIALFNIQEIQRFSTADPRGFFTSFFAVTVATALLTVVLLAAAVARRLHDRGLSGAWGLLPLPFVIFGLGGMFYMIMGFPDPPNVRLFLLIFANNIVYLVALVVLIVLLAGAGAAGPNRHGPDPKA